GGAGGRVEWAQIHRVAEVGEGAGQRAHRARVGGDLGDARVLGGGGNQQRGAVAETGQRGGGQLGQPRAVAQQRGGRHRARRGDDLRDGRVQGRIPGGEVLVDERADRRVPFGHQTAVIEQRRSL